MELIAIVEDAWGWAGIKPDQVVGDNDFGNLMVKDRSGSYWRICPEDLSCKIVATSKAELDDLSRNQKFLDDWHMVQLVQQAQERLGPLRPGFKYCLKIPGALGGEYGGDNLATISLGGLISASGQIAQQVKDLPDGAGQAQHHRLARLTLRSSRNCIATPSTWQEKLAMLPATRCNSA